MLQPFVCVVFIFICAATTFAEENNGWLAPTASDPGDQNFEEDLSSLEEQTLDKFFSKWVNNNEEIKSDNLRLTSEDWIHWPSANDELSHHTNEDANFHKRMKDFRGYDAEEKAESQTGDSIGNYNEAYDGTQFMPYENNDDESVAKWIMELLKNNSDEEQMQSKNEERTNWSTETYDWLKHRTAIETKDENLSYYPDQERAESEKRPQGEHTDNVSQEGIIPEFHTDKTGAYGQTLKSNLEAERDAWIEALNKNLTVDEYIESNHESTMRTMNQDKTIETKDEDLEKWLMDVIRNYTDQERAESERRSQGEHTDNVSQEGNIPEFHTDKTGAYGQNLKSNFEAERDAWIEALNKNLTVDEYNESNHKNGLNIMNQDKEKENQSDSTTSYPVTEHTACTTADIKTVRHEDKTHNHKVISPSIKISIVFENNYDKADSLKIKEEADQADNFITNYIYRGNGIVFPNRERFANDVNEASRDPLSFNAKSNMYNNPTIILNQLNSIFGFVPRPGAVSVGGALPPLGPFIPPNYIYPAPAVVYLPYPFNKAV